MGRSRWAHGSHAGHQSCAAFTQRNWCDVRRFEIHEFREGPYSGMDQHTEVSLCADVDQLLAQNAALTQRCEELESAVKVAGDLLGSIAPIEIHQQSVRDKVGAAFVHLRHVSAALRRAEGENA